MKSIGIVAGLSLSVGATVGCTSSHPVYLTGYRFAPEPALAVMLKQGTQSPALSVMVSVIGIRRGDSDNALPPAVEVRMRFENQGTAPIDFDPHSAMLVNGGLQSFEVPDVRPPSPLHLLPSQNASVTLFFPFPSGANYRTMPIDTMRLRWQVQIEGQSFLQTAYFERTTPLYYEQ